MKGKISINLVFHNLTSPMQLSIVLNLAGPPLLGTDFLTKYHVKVDFFNNSFTIYKNMNDRVIFDFKLKRFTNEQNEK